MLRYIVPIFDKKLLGPMLQISLVCSLVAGLYGVIHDQVTFTISNEYFTKLKYKQFHYLQFDGNDRLKISAIGFFATFWVGFFFGWLLSRWYLPYCSLSVGRKKIFKSSLIVLLTSALFAVVGSVFALFRDSTSDYSNWICVFNTYDIESTQNFVHVAYIHNASYLGALVGLLIVLVCVKRKS